MSFRAVVLLVVFMLVVGASTYVALNNEATLKMPLRLYGHELPVYAAVAWAFVLGFGMTFGLVLVRTSKRAFGRWRGAREARARERLERLYAQGLEGLLGGSTERAEARFREVLAKDAEHVETLMTYGDMLRGLGRPREAADLHRRAADLRPGDMRPLFALASDCSADGNLDQARGALELVIAANPKASLKARRELRDLLIGARRWEEALHLHDSLEASGAKDDPGRARERRLGLGIRFEMARAAQARGALREAEKEYRSLLRADPAFVPASLALGETLVAQGAAEEGVRVWRRGYEATQSPVFFARLEEHHLSREEPEVIIGLMRSLVESSRSRVVPAFYLGKLYLRLEMIDEAESTLASIQGSAPDAPALRYMAAMVLERRGRLKEALELYRSVIRDARILRPRYLCRSCKASLAEAATRCPACGDWGTIDVDLAEIVPPADAGTLPPPGWAAGA